MIKFFRKLSSEDKTLKATIRGIVGAAPSNLDLYKLAVRHSSISKDSNERLEFLGDAILGSIVAEFLFKKFPFKDEGFLTEIRSRIVKRDSLNTLAIKIGLDKIVKYNKNSRKGPNSHRSIYGNALEAFIGAIYLDKGYKASTKFVVHQLIGPFVDIEELIANNSNFKSILIEWSQKHGHDLNFKIVKEEGENHSKTFTAEVIVNSESIGQGAGASKKKAEQAAAEMSCEFLKIN